MTKNVFRTAYIFITLPFVIFTIGYIKSWIAIPIILIVLFSLYQMINDIPEIQFPVITKKEIIIISCTMILLFIWVLLSGIGKIGWQRGDHTVRNGIYEALVNEPWPVGVGYVHDGQDQLRMLVYYIGFWLPSAVFGKIFGIQAGYYFQVFWTVFGLGILYFLISIWRKKFSAWTMIIFIFFSGLDIIILAIANWEWIPIFATDFLENKTSNYLFTSFTVDLFDVFNQSIPAWITTILLLMQKNGKSIIFIWSTLLLSATFPFIGMLPIILYIIWTEYSKERLNSCRLLNKNIFTFRNIVGGGAIGIITAGYLAGNVSAGMVGSNLLADFPIIEIGNRITATVNVVSMALVNFTVKNVINNSAFQYIIFIILEFICYYLIIYRYFKKNILYYIVLATLMIIPFIRVGGFVDFCMRASIPALFILFLFVIEYLENSKEKRKKLVLGILLIISSLSAIHLIANSIVNYSGERQKTASIREICLGSNFGGASDSLFFKYLSKPIKGKELDVMRINYCEPDENEYYVEGPYFSKEKNQLAAQELYIEFNWTNNRDVTLIDRGILDDNSVTYTVSLNGHDLGTLNHRDRIVVLPKEYLNEYAQAISIKISREVKLYGSDDIKLFIAE